MAFFVRGFLLLMIGWLKSFNLGSDTKWAKKYCGCSLILILLYHLRFFFSSKPVDKCCLVSLTDGKCLSHLGQRKMYENDEALALFISAL